MNTVILDLHELDDQGEHQGHDDTESSRSRRGVAELALRVAARRRRLRAAEVAEACRRSNYLSVCLTIPLSIFHPTNRAGSWGCRTRRGASA